MLRAEQELAYAATARSTAARKAHLTLARLHIDAATRDRVTETAIVAVIEI